MRDKNASRQKILRTTALTALLIGVIGSLYFMYDIGRNQKSILLLGLFTLWVLSPFIGLFISDQLSKRWWDKIKTWLYWAIIILTIVSLTIYSKVLTISHTKPAFNFLAVPFFSWLVILTIMLIAKRLTLKDTDET